jgi:hypothetical protein
VTEKSEMTSRRQAFSILGLAALGLSVMPNLLMVSEAEAQTSAATPPAPQTGTERRQARRTARVQRREERRNARQTGRTERAQARRGETPQGAGTPGDHAH